MVKWFVYALVFFVAAFFLHFVVETAVSLVVGVVAPDTADSTVGLITLVLGFALAGLVTWLIARSGLQVTRNEEDKVKGDAFLEEEHRRLEAAEQQHEDEMRLGRLMTELSAWRRAHDVRSYAAEALEELGDGDATTGDGGSLRAELQWAIAYADQIDPLHAARRLPPAGAPGSPPT